MAKRKTARRKSARRSQRTGSTLAPIVDQLRKELAKPADAPNQPQRVERLAARLHAARAPEKKKLLEKDRLVIDLIANFRRNLGIARARGDITRVEFILFSNIGAVLDMIENVLWELKGNTGPRPKPRPLPTPQPSPGPRTIPT